MILEKKKRNSHLNLKLNLKHEFLILKFIGNFRLNINAIYEKTIYRMGEILGNYASNKALTTRLYEELTNFNSIKASNSVKKCARNVNKHFP